MVVVERKTGIEGVAEKNIVDDVVSYKVNLDGKEKTLADSTFKRNYKILNKNNGGNEMETIVENVIVEELNKKELEASEDIVVVEDKKVEIVLTEKDKEKVELLADQLSLMVKSLSIVKELTIEKNVRKCTMVISDTPFAIDIDCELRLVEGLVESLKNKLGEDVEVKYDNKYKRPNPSAFKARGVEVKDKNGESTVFKTRNDAMIWITSLFEKGELDKKPTYYQVKKALEKNLEYMGYTWSEI